MAEALITLGGVSKDYVGGGGVVHALRDVDIVIEKGEFVAIVGTSGSGKSTLMNILGCLDRPTRGTYTLADIEVGARGNDARAIVRNRLIGFIFQGFNLLPRTTALENVELPLQYRGVSSSARRKRAQEALASVGLADREHHTPNQLSGGQQQRVAIARALVSDPPLLLADEPTGNLDTRTSLEVLALLQKLNRDVGITIVLVTHEHDIAACANRVMTFRDGRMVSDVRQEKPMDAAAGLADLPPTEVYASADDGAADAAHLAHTARQPVPFSVYAFMFLGALLGMLVGYVYGAAILGHQSPLVRWLFAAVFETWIASRMAERRLGHPLSSPQRLNVSLWYTGFLSVLVGVGGIIALSQPSVWAQIGAGAKHLTGPLLSVVVVLVMGATALLRYLLLTFFSTIARSPKRAKAHVS
jgi:putative ABC transport system ATP-binding protein